MKSHKTDVYCIMGTFLLSVGIQNFLDPVGLVPGGISGLGMIIDDISKKIGGPSIPLWLINIICNVPLFVIAWRIHGKKFVSKTIMTSFLFSLMLYIVSWFPQYMGDLLTAAVCGGVCSGIGLGLVLRSGTTTGGVELAAYLLHRRIFAHVHLAVLIFCIDATIIAFGVLTFGFTNTIYAVISVGIMDKVLHMTIEGITQKRIALIFSREITKIKQSLQQNDIDCVYHEIQQQQTKILFCVFAQKDIHKVKTIIVNIDTNALFLLTQMQEVLGKK